MALGKPAGVALIGIALSVPAHAFAGRADVPRRHQPCPRYGAEVIASDELVRVYVYPQAKRPVSPHGRSRRLSPPHHTEACLVRTGARMTLLDPGQPSESRGFVGFQAIAGNIVAYSSERDETGSASSTVFVADIAARRILRELTVGNSPYAKVSSRTRMTAFALAPSGSAAWIDEKTTWTSFRHGPDTKTFVVSAAPLGVQEVVLDESPYIGESSLTLTSGTLAWWDGGAERSARLP